MYVKTITVSEYAKFYGCSNEFVTRQLRKGVMMSGMVSFRKLEGRTGSWLIEVLVSWIDGNEV